METELELGLSEKEWNPRHFFRFLLFRLTKQANQDLHRHYVPNFKNKYISIDTITMLTSSKTLLHRSGPLASKALLKPVGTPPTTVSSSLLAKAFFATSPTNITSTTLSSLRRASSPLQQHSLYAIRPFSAAISPNETIKGTVSDGVSSSAELKKDKAGYVTKKLRVLDMDVVEKIKNELKSVDANSDGR